MITTLFLCVVVSFILSGLSHLMERFGMSNLLRVICDLLLFFVVVSALGLTSLISVLVVVISKIIMDSSVPWNTIFKN